MKKKSMRGWSVYTLLLSLVIILSTTTSFASLTTTGNDKQLLQEKFFGEIQGGDFERVRSLFRARASVHDTNESGSTPLHWAVLLNHFDIARFLIKVGAVVNAHHRKDRSTPLHEAAYEGNVDMLELLLDHDADVTLKDRRGKTPLQMAQKRNRTTAIDLLLQAEKGAKGTRVERDDSTPKTPAQHNHDRQHEASQYEVHAKRNEGKAQGVELASPPKKSTVDSHKKGKGVSSSTSVPTKTLAQLAASLKNPENQSKAYMKRKKLATRKKKQPISRAQQFIKSLYSKDPLSCEKFLQDDPSLVNFLDMDCARFTPLHHVMGATIVNKKELVEQLIKYKAHVCAKSHYLSTPLHLAVHNGSKEVVELLLKKNALFGINEENMYGGTPLHIAVQRGYKDIVEVLVAHKEVDANSKNSEGNTPLHVAVVKGHTQVVSTLLARNVDTTILNNHDKTALDLAQELKKVDIIKLLDKSSSASSASSCASSSTMSSSPHETRSTPSSVAGPTHYGSHSMSFGTLSGSSFKVNNSTNYFNNMITSLGADSTKPRKKSSVPSVSSQGSSIKKKPGKAKDQEEAEDSHEKDEGLKEQSDKGSVSPSTPHGASATMNNDGVTRSISTPSMSSSSVSPSSGSTVSSSPSSALSISLSLSSGVMSSMSTPSISSLSVSPSSGSTVSSSSSSASSSSSSLSSGVMSSKSTSSTSSLGTSREDDVDVTKVGKNGITPLHHAAKAGRLEVVQRLLDKRANLEAVTQSGWPYYGMTPLHVAVEDGRAEVVKLLLESRANTKAVARYGQTPLHCAAEKGHTEIVRLLLGNRAKIEAVTHYGEAPLNRAAGNGRTEVVKLLLERGANIGAVDKGGITPLHWAALKGHTEIVRLLIESHANREALDKDGKTPLHWAAEHGHTEIVRLLLERGAQIDVVNTSGKTPLQLARNAGRKEVVEILSKAGAKG